MSSVLASVSAASGTGVTAVATALAWWLYGSDTIATRDRLRRLHRARPGFVAPAPTTGRTASAIALGAVVGAVAAVVVGVAAGLLVGSLVAWLALRARARRAAARDRRRRSPGRRVDVARPGALPAALDLLVACLFVGATPDRALESVASAFGGAVGELLDGVARRTALGAPPETAWAAALIDPSWAAVARAVIRAHHSGASLTDVLTRLADDRRRELRAAAEAAAQRAAVRAVLPLGICFLPAFALVGVVPVVAGFATSLWG